MKLVSITLLLTTLALANPAPVADPEAIAQPEIEALAARVAALEVHAREVGTQLEARKVKSPPKSGNSNNTNSSGAAGLLTPSRTLELGALSLGVMEILRLWG